MESNRESSGLGASSGAKPINSFLRSKSVSGKKNSDDVIAHNFNEHFERFLIERSHFTGPSESSKSKKSRYWGSNEFK